MGDFTESTLNVLEAPSSDKKGRIYIAGPMTGIPNYNKAAFTIAETMLEDAGWKYVYNPFDAPQADKSSIYTTEETRWIYYMFNGIQSLHCCSHIFLLSGWEESKGAQIEYRYAISQGKKIWFERHALPF